MKKVILLGLTSGILAGVAAFIFNLAYSKALLVDFSKVIPLIGLFISPIVGCLLASFGYLGWRKLVKKGTDASFNAIFLVVTFATCVSPFSATLPLDIESPELFPGLVIPMHLFPILFWLAVKPIFFNLDTEKNSVPTNQSN